MAKGAAGRKSTKTRSGESSMRPPSSSNTPAARKRVPPTDALADFAAPSFDELSEIECSICGKLAELNAVNWYEEEPGQGGRIVPKGNLCKTCGDFAAASPWSGAELIAMSSTKRLRAQTLDDIDSMQSNKAAIIANQPVDYDDEEVFEELVHESYYVEDCDFQDKDSFKEEFGVTPEDCRMTMVKVTTRSGEELTGVATTDVPSDYSQAGFSADQSAIQAGPRQNKPFLRFITGRRLVKRNLVLPRSKQIYKRQAEAFFTKCRDENSKCLGFKWGNRYEPAKRSVNVYSKLEVKKMVGKGQGPKLAPGLASMSKSSGSVVQRSNSGFSAGGISPTPAVITPQKALQPLSLCDIDACFEELPESEASPIGTIDGQLLIDLKSFLDSGPPGQQEQGGVRDTGTPCSSNDGDVTADDVETREQLLSLKKMRVKPISYWLHELTEARVWQGRFRIGPRNPYFLCFYLWGLGGVWVCEGRALCLII
jgi:hypothetical protein